MKNYFFVCFFLAVCGCAKPFQPPPSEFEQWKKQGVSFHDVKTEMLRCGFDNVYGNGMMDDNAYAKAQNCMFKKGFSHTSGFDICRNKKSLPACRF